MDRLIYQIKQIVPHVTSAQLDALVELFAEHNAVLDEIEEVATWE